MSVLIVEDDEITAKIISKQLTKRDYFTEVVTDGESCLRYLEDKLPSIILLDYMLPGISGLEVLKTVRKKFSMVELPIILVTAKTDVSDVVTALKFGANDYISKPINIDILSARIKIQSQLQQYYLESLRNQELQTINAMIITYNHEINNPLMIASHNLEIVDRTVIKDNQNIGKALKSLARIADILDKIKKVTLGPVKKQNYRGETKMIDIHKK